MTAHYKETGRRLTPGATGGPAGRYLMHRYPGQRVKTTASIFGTRQIETFEAMCVINARLPHEMAADILLDAIRTAQHDHEVQEVAAAMQAMRTSQPPGATPARGRRA